jgi:hypothetical protein
MIKGIQPFTSPKIGGALVPSASMENKHDQPRCESKCAGGKGDDHKPAHHAKLIEQRSVIFAVDHAGMHRAFTTRQPCALAIT